MTRGNADSGVHRSVWARSKAKVKGWVQALWRPALYLGMLLGCLMGRALPGAHIAPFGLALFAAARSAGVTAAGGLPVALAILAGSLSAQPLQQGLWILLGLVVCQLGSSALRLGRKGTSALGAALMATASAAAASTPFYAPHNLVPTLFWCGLAGVSAFIFTLGINGFLNGQLWGRGGASAVPAVVILAAALIGLEGIYPWGLFSLRDLMTGVVILVAAYTGGPLFGAATGAVFGLGFLFPALAQAGGLAAGSQGMAYVAGGLLAGTFRDLRRVGSTLAFCLGLVTYSMATVQNAAELLRVAYSAGLAGLLFMVVPGRWSGAISAAFSPMWNARLQASSSTQQPLSLAERIQGMSRALKEVAYTFEQVAVVNAEEDEATAPPYAQVTDTLCRSCSMYSHCWEKSPSHTRQLFDGLWQKMSEDGHLTSQPLPAGLEDHCIYASQVVLELNHLYESYRTYAHWERRLADGRSVVVDYARDVARMLDRFADQVGPSGSHLPTGDPVLRVVSGSARLPKRGGLISGDSYALEPLGTGRYLMALSDGMGVGRGAATESKQCVRLLREILRAGFATDVAVKTVNSALLLNAPEESFATVDLALFDLTTGRAEFVKIGAVPSFIKRGDDVLMVKMSSVPVGIINQVDVEPDFRLLRPGDIVVMMTDGIWDVARDATDKEGWVLDHLSRERSSDPVEIAESLLGRAVELMPDAADDMTVLAARVDAAGGLTAKEPARPTPTADWAPVRQAPHFQRKRGDQAKK